MIFTASTSRTSKWESAARSVIWVRWTSQDTHRRTSVPGSGWSRLWDSRNALNREN